MGESKKLAWLILARMVVVSLFLGSITFLYLRDPENLGAISLSGLTRLAVVTYVFSIVSLTMIRLTPRFNLTISYLQIVWDILFVTVLVLLTGGATSSYPFLYNLAIINACVILARREAIYTASLCGIVYGAIIDLH